MWIQSIAKPQQFQLQSKSFLRRRRWVCVFYSRFNCGQTLFCLSLPSFCFHRLSNALFYLSNILKLNCSFNRFDRNKKIIFLFCGRVPSRSFAWAFTTLSVSPLLPVQKEHFWLSGGVSGERVEKGNSKQRTWQIFDISPTPCYESTSSAHGLASLPPELMHRHLPSFSPSSNFYTC